jgi:hypothetical protein
MCLANALVDHDGKDGQPVHRGLVAKAGGALARVSPCGRCEALKLTTRGAKARVDDEEPHRGLHGSAQRRGGADVGRE